LDSLRSVAFPRLRHSKFLDPFFASEAKALQHKHRPNEGCATVRYQLICVGKNLLGFTVLKRPEGDNPSWGGGNDPSIRETRRSSEPLIVRAPQFS
jgi:hypothetical protein